MVLQFDSADSIYSQPPTASRSSSLCSDSSACGLEGGYLFHEEIDTSILSKFIPVVAGKPSRRRSRCEYLSFRQQSESTVDNAIHTLQLKRLTYAPVSQPATFSRRSSTMASTNIDLSKSIQFYPSSKEQLNSPSHSKKFYLLAQLAFLSIIGTSIFIYMQQDQLTSLRQELETTNQHRQYMDQSRTNLLAQLANREQTLDQFRHTHEQTTKINHDVSESMKKLREEHASSVKELKRLHAVQKRLHQSEDRWEKYVEGMQKRSHRSAVEKFGKGPHSVELQVQLPSSHTQGTAELLKINIELAPLDMMPHSVHTFLEQVDRGAWDGTAFDMHVGHVLVARPSPSSLKGYDSEVPTVTFPEYNAQYPHDKYTIGFPGRPSSSQNFYINLKPNNIHHSPRIETEDYVDGEPCFGRIVDESSRRVVDRMDGLSVGEGALFEESVLIRSARILGR